MNASVNEDECKAKFRFEKGDVYRLSDALQLPDQFVCRQGSVRDNIEGLRMILRRLPGLSLPPQRPALLAVVRNPFQLYACMNTSCVLGHIYE